MTSTQPEDLREQVRTRYAAAANTLELTAHSPVAGSACCGGSSCGTAEDAVFGGSLYDGADRPDPSAGLDEALAGSLGCGVPTAVADLHEGETVLDLGSGAGADVLISARRVGPTGRVIGVDMTPQMLDLARRNAAAAGAENVEFLEGYLEALPLLDASVDIVISNCVINLAADKDVVLAEAARVTRPGGRFAVSDIIADLDMDPGLRQDLAAVTGCISGALTQPDYRRALEAAGWEQVEIRPTHRVHPQAQSAIIRAVRRN